MNTAESSILLVGESGAGKTHYGAQMLQRLMKGDGCLRMSGAATNLEPFEAALESLNEGRAAHHTPTAMYVDSVWPISDRAGRAAQLVWPEYGGEQIKAMISARRVPNAWQGRIQSATAWLLLVRLQQTRAGDDIFSRPITELRGKVSQKRDVQISDQARLIELLQMLIFVGGAQERPVDRPRLGIMLSCWDELSFDGLPAAALESRMPMLAAFVRSNWRDPMIVGLSALERPLSSAESDQQYVSRGPEEFGYVIQSDGLRTSDLTAPIQQLLNNFA